MSIIYPIGWVNPVPQSVPMLNARMAMYNAGWLAPWEAQLATMAGPEGDLARIKYATAQNVRRDDPLVITGLEVLGKTPEEGDALFAAAAALTP